VTAVCEIHTKQIKTLCRKNVEFLKDTFKVTYIDHCAVVDSWVRMNLKQPLRNLRFLRAVTKKSAACWDMTPSGLASIY
jgi:adenine deaminase